MGSGVKYSYKAAYTLPTPTEYNDVIIGDLEEGQDTSLFPSFRMGSDKGASQSRTELLSIERLPCTWRNVYAVRLGHSSDFTPGDAVGLVVPNSDEIVERLMTLCGITDRRCRIERVGKGPFIFEGQVRDFFKYKYDFTGIPKKIHLLNLAKSSPLRKHIEYICSPEGARDYIGLGVNWHSIVDIIEHFDCKPCLEDLIRNCETIKPRYYTLINDKADNHEILVGEISKEGVSGVKYGHVSGYINTLYHSCFAPRLDTDSEAASGTYMKRGCSSAIESTFRRNVLIGRMEAEYLICFCTGTGIALFLSLYRNRPAGQKIILVYGYRNDEDDISRLYDLDCDILRAKSSEGARVTRYCSIVDPYRGACKVVICGNMAMQRSIFLELQRLYPELSKEGRIFLDNWQ